MRGPVRWIVLAAAVAVVVALFLVLRPGAEDDPSASPSPTVSVTPSVTPSDTPTAEPSEPTVSPTPDAREIEIEVEDGQVQGPDQVEVARGERLRLVVQADVADEVHVHGYDLMAEVAPGAPAVITFRADAPGVFEVELEDAGLLLLQLRVQA